METLPDKIKRFHYNNRYIVVFSSTARKKIYCHFCKVHSQDPLFLRQPTHYQRPSPAPNSLTHASAYKIFVAYAIRAVKAFVVKYIFLRLGVKR